MRFVFLAAWLTVVCPAGAIAQARVPDTEMWGIGGDLGLFVPKEGAFDNALELQGLAEYYFTPRTSVRTGFGWTEPSFEGREDDGLRVTRLTIDVLYNWEGGKIHPFVGAGLGAYFLRSVVNGESVGESRSKAGFNLGGGIEYFTSRTVTVKGEARYHIVNDDGVPDASGLSLTIGLKKYF